MPKRKVSHNSDNSDDEPDGQERPSDDDNDDDDDMDEVKQSRKRKSKRPSKKEEERDTSDEDEEPESVPFVDSKKSVLDRVRSAIKQIERDNEQVKASRRKKHALFTEQKKQKSLSTLTKLPADILMAVHEQPLRPMTAKKSKPQQKVKATSGKARSISQKSTDEAIDPEQSGEDFIPLSISEVIRPVDPADVALVAVSSAQNAVQFKHRQQFGNNIRREPVSKFMGISAKRRASKAR